MQNAESLTTEQISEFLKASGGIEFAGQSRAEVYEGTERMLVQQEYTRQGRKQRGAIRAYLSKVTGRSLPQITRLVRKYVKTGRVKPKPFRRAASRGSTPRQTSCYGQKWIGRTSA